MSDEARRDVEEAEYRAESERKAEQEQIAREEAERRARAEAERREEAERKAEETRPRQEVEAKLVAVKGVQERMANTNYVAGLEALKKRGDELNALRAEAQRELAEAKALAEEGDGEKAKAAEEKLAAVDQAIEANRRIAEDFIVARLRRQGEAELKAHAEVERKAQEGTVAKGGGSSTIDLGGGVSLEMVHCPSVSSDFWMGKYEVTQEQWQRVMGGNPSSLKETKNPVDCVSWNDCQEFIRKLNALPGARASGLTFCLPTEQEWKTACRAGAPETADYCKLKDGTQITASTLSRVAKYGASDDGPVNVGSFEPNAWGLYDMHGNVWEWTETEFRGKRMLCGGSFEDTAELCSAGAWSWSNDGYGPLGFRLAASGRAATR